MSEQTRQEWRRRILLAMRAMETDVTGELSLEAIAREAHFSPYHFHRIFTGMTGETVGAWRRRLRLAWAAYKLTYGTKPVTEVAFQAGFEAPEAFTRAFRAVYGVPPSTWRRQRREQLDLAALMKLIPKIKEILPMELTVAVKQLPPLRVACVRHVGPYDQCEAAWAKLCGLVAQHGLFGQDTRFVGVGYDDPAITPPEKIRYDACLTMPDTFAGTVDLPVAVIANGEYACAVVKGPYTLLAPAYAWLCGVWGPDSGREFAAAPCLEFYLNDPKTTPPEAWLTEICVPLEPQK